MQPCMVKQYELCQTFSHQVSCISCEPVEAQCVFPSMKVKSYVYDRREDVCTSRGLVFYSQDRKDSDFNERSLNNVKEVLVCPDKLTCWNWHLLLPDHWWLLDGPGRWGGSRLQLSSGLLCHRPPGSHFDSALNLSSAARDRQTDTHAIDLQHQSPQTRSHAPAHNARAHKQCGF